VHLNIKQQPSAGFLPMVNRNQPLVKEISAKAICEVVLHKNENETRTKHHIIIK